VKFRLFLLLLLCICSDANAQLGTLPFSGASITPFTGFLDQFTGLSPTWGVSAYKLTNSYSGNWGTVERQSDSTTQTIGFLNNGKVDVGSFNTFCASTNCYLTSSTSLFACDEHLSMCATVSPPFPLALAVSPSSLSRHLHLF
jgi:alpha-L-arabinofuranosidase B-like protein